MTHAVVVVITIRNTTGSTTDYSILPTDSLLSDSTSHTYSPDSAATSSLPQCKGTSFYDLIAPGASYTGCEVFDVPVDATPVTLQMLVTPTLHWRLSDVAVVPTTSGNSGGTGGTGDSGSGGTGGTGDSGSGDTGGTGDSGSGDTGGTGTGTATGPVTPKHHGKAPKPAHGKAPKPHRVKAPKPHRVKHPKASSATPG